MELEPPSLHTICTVCMLAIMVLPIMSLPTGTNERCYVIGGRGEQEPANGNANGSIRTWETTSPCPLPCRPPFFKCSLLFASVLPTLPYARIQPSNKSRCDVPTYFIQEGAARGSAREAGSAGIGAVHNKRVIL